MPDWSEVDERAAFRDRLVRFHRRILLDLNGREMADADVLRLGALRQENLELLRRSGFKKALLVDEKFADAGADVLTRITMYGSSPVEVRMRSLGF